MSTEDSIVAVVAAPVSGAVLDIAQAWVDGLQATDSRHEDCLVRLHALLVRVARHEAFRRGAMLQLQGPELEDVAQQAADDSLMAIKAKIAEFRGGSRFTTWAYRFVMLEVSTKIGRHFWRNRPATMDEDSWERLPDPLPVAPQQLAEHHEMLEELRRAITDDLTDLQRRVFVAVALNEVPMDAFARELGSNRNAVYKALFDARCKLRVSLDAAGYPLASREGAA